MLSGVGEGTIAGPLFFILVLDPISSVISRASTNIISNANTFSIKIEKDMFNVTSREYADDVSGVLWADNDEILQVAATETMRQFKQFFSAIGMSLNPKKTEVLCIRSKEKTLDISIEGQPESSSLRLLGLVIDANMNFEMHVSQIKRNINFKMICLRRLAPFMNFLNLKRISEALVYNSVACCLPIFGHSLKLQRSLQKSINTSARIVLGRGLRTSATQMLSDLNWLNVRNLFFLESICSLNRIISTKSAVYTFQTILNGSRSKQQVYNTRDNSLQLDLDYRSKYIKQSFVFNAIQAINDLNLHKKLVPVNVPYRKFVKDEILRRYENQNI